MGQLNGKNCLITGAAGSIDLASAKLFVKEGANVSFVDRDEGALRQAASALHTYRDRLLKRHAAADEIARSALFLASGASSFTTGSVLMVDGGLSA